MQIYGRDVHFKRTVGATCEIEQFAPDGDVARIREYFSDAVKFSESMGVCARIMCALNKGYIQSQKYSGEECDEKPVTYDELMTLEESAFMDLFMEALDAYSREKPQIETEPVKKTEKAAKSPKK